jgi:surface antigen
MTSSSLANETQMKRHLKRPIRLALSLGAGLCLLATALPGHAVWHWMRGAAVTDFSESDWVLLKEAAQDMLDNRPDREQVNWSNPDTGNRGSLIVLATFSHDGQVCRRAAMRNLTFRGRDEKAAYSLCQQEDGTWQFVAESALLDEASTSPG